MAVRKFITDFMYFLQEQGFQADPKKFEFLDESYTNFLLSEYHFQEYHFSFVKALAAFFDMEGKIVLEIGGCNLPEDIMVSMRKPKVS